MVTREGGCPVVEKDSGRGGGRRVNRGLFHKMNAAQKEEALKGYVTCNRVSFRTFQGGGGISRVY